MHREVNFALASFLFFKKCKCKREPSSGEICQKLKFMKFRVAKRCALMNFTSELCEESFPLLLTYFCGCRDGCATRTCHLSAASCVTRAVSRRVKCAQLFPPSTDDADGIEFWNLVEILFCTLEHTQTNNLRIKVNIYYSHKSKKY